MLDKNPQEILDNDLTYVKKEFSIKNPNMILCSEPFLKAEILNELIDSIIYPVIFLDFDLLYSGYVVSELIKKNERVEIYRPNKIDLKKIISEIANKISSEKFLVIIDSLNGFYNVFDEKESGRFINASLMLLSSISRENGSSVIITAITRKNDGGEWILSPGGRHIIDSKKSGMFHLKRIDKSMIIRSLNQIGNAEKIFRIELSNV
ncbi:hypothetical protein [Nitrosarchaeum sp.]|uniref:hypothetical protein n=1 Tax=Nitrosarchaeum sp. TaxID=2026886 RepID=UPI00247E8C18|nr:hypothetical protein [Nitrosarchaeum sp.]MCV0412539.1 hypothetical protein [Nitrosarchaeum sp.]